MASTAEKLDPELWEEAKADAREKFGGHSARAMQYAVKLYKERGGRYRGKKQQDNRLAQWAAQDWTTKSGRPSRETGERYLPRDAIAALTPAEYGATTRAKRAGGGVGQSVAQPKSIREKTRKFRKVNPMPTPAQIAARKKFAERARSGELAKMRKKNPAKKPTRAASRKANPSPKWNTKISNPYFFDKYGDKGLTIVAEKTTMEEGYVPVELSIIYNEPKGVYQYAHGMVIEKEHTPSEITARKLADLWYKTNKEMFTISTPRRSNPTATRAPARKRTKLITNGERKKNPATKDVFFVNVIDDGGFQFGMDDRTPVLFKFSNREMKRGVYRSFALPFNVTSNPQFQDFVKSLPGNQIVISLKDLRKQLSAYA